MKEGHGTRGKDETKASAAAGNVYGMRGDIIAAMRNLIPVHRGYWYNDIDMPHAVPMKVLGQCGSVRVPLVPALRGSGGARSAMPHHVEKFCADGWAKPRVAECNWQIQSQRALEVLFALGQHARQNARSSVKEHEWALVGELDRSRPAVQLLDILHGLAQLHPEQTVLEQLAGTAPLSKARAFINDT